VRGYPSSKHVCSTARLAARLHALRPCARQPRGYHYKSGLVVSRSTCPPISPPSPRTQLCTRSCSNKHTHVGLDSLTTPRTHSPSSRHPPFTHKPFPPRSLVCGGQPSPHKPRLVVSHSTCPPLSSSPHAHRFVLGPAVINNNLNRTKPATCPPLFPPP
jgi:hypothetical protein